MLQSLDFLCIDKEVHIYAELMSTLEVILRRLCRNSIPFGGVLIMCTIDHTQLVPVKGKQFLVSYHILSCFKIGILQHYICSFNDPEFQRFQQIACIHHDMYSTNPELLRDFRLLSVIVFTFVSECSSE